MSCCRGASCPPGAQSSKEPSSADRTNVQAELTYINRPLKRLVDALADGMPVTAVNQRLAGREKRCLILGQDLATDAAPAPHLYPKLAKFYRSRMASLSKL